MKLLTRVGTLVGVLALPVLLAAIPAHAAPKVAVSTPVARSALQPRTVYSPHLNPDGSGKVAAVAPGVVVCGFNYSPKHVSVGVHIRPVTFYIWFSNECGTVYSYRLHPEHGSYTDGITATGSPMVFHPNFMKNGTAGRAHMVLDIWWTYHPEGETAGAGHLLIQRLTHIEKFNCAPEPIRAGQNLYCTGRLEIVTWGHGQARYVSFPDQYVVLINYNRDAGSTLIDIHHTNYRGRFHFAQRPQISEWWKVQFPSPKIEYTSAETRYDLIVVE